MSDPQRPSLYRLMEAVANDGEKLESPSGTVLAPDDVLALITERDLLRRDVDRLRGLVHSLLANDPNEVVADAHPVTVLDVWRRDAYLVMAATDDG